MLLASKRFLPLFVTQFFGAFNDNACKNSLLIWLTYQGLGTENMINFAAALFIIPFFLFSALAGQLADRYEKSMLARKFKIIEIWLMLFFAFCLFFKSVSLLLLALFFMGIQSTFFGPIKYSLLPEHLGQSELVLGNGLIEGGTFIAILLGTIFGSLIITYAHGTKTFSIFVLAFALIGWLASRYIPKSKFEPSINLDLNIVSSTKKLITIAKENRVVWRSIIAISWFWFVGVSFITQLPIYTKNVIHGSPSVVTLFLATFSIGIGLGSIICNFILKGEISTRLVPLANIVITLGIMMFYIASKYFIYSPSLLNIQSFIEYKGSIYIILSLLTISFFSGIYTVPLYAKMQHCASPVVLSRIIAANNVLNALFMVGASIWAVVLFNSGFAILQVLLSVGILNFVFLFYVKDRQ